MDPTRDPVRDLIVRRIKDLGLSLSGASREVGRNHAYLQQFLERGIPAELPEKLRPKLAALLKVDESQLRHNEQAPPLTGSQPASPTVASGSDGPPTGMALTRAPELTTMSHDMPIYGVTRCGKGEGDFRFNGEVAGQTLRPPGLRGMKDAFCLYVQGESMSPWRNEGDRVFINPARPARIGDHVVIEVKPEHDGEPGVAWLKKLAGRSPDGTLVLAQYNPPNGKIKVPGHKVKRVFRVMEWEELLTG
jgi:phage repressor protein C with HTH and peptisase S24 domain